ncbi:hypothetical protein PPTG_20027 [Phytophthora nicotianae INRA-310]|uniref:Uncharacterized protein n=1 Tax=Phytophthora nicotianae (strain INRA-310) TaxID=761204 RepID=W2PAG9_PHYN3|nr:hypothetical protein PPTG_20027 [Phytophthora nicotianae INRA-310]ETM97796.1 hypothetical protein PPTG_20027 [Phytophthora nicotianae INRA-310]
MLAPKALTMGCNVKTGTKGVDFFHGENALLDFVYAALDFCKCQNIQLVLKEPLPPSPGINTTKRKRSTNQTAPASSSPAQELSPKNKGKAKRAKEASSDAASLAKPNRKKPAGKATKSQNPVKKKKMTKKQLREEEEEQRREKSSFSTIWSPPRSDGPLTSSSCRSQISDDQISADLQEHAERGDLDGMRH